MNGIILTQSETFIIGPIAKLLGYIMQGIFFVLDLIGIPNIGLAIIIFTIVIYLLLMPLTIKQQKFSKLSAKMNPELTAIREKYKGKKDNVRCRLNCDTDGDGKPDRNIDLDGDGICDLNCDTEKTVVIEDKDVPKKDDDKKDDKKEEEEKNEGVFEIVFEEIKPLKSELIYPGWKGYYAFKIKNSTVKNIKYNISLVNITNNFTETNNLYYVIKKNGSVIGTEKRAPYHDEKILDNITINAKTEDNYTITYEFKDTNIPQDEDQNKTFKSTVRVAIAE